MRILTFPLGPFQTNCYLICKDDSKECFIFDPGNQGEQVVTYLEEEGFKPQAILLTHGHADHIGAVQAIVDHFNIPVYIHEGDKPMLQSAKLNLSSQMGDNIQVNVEPKVLKEDDVLLLGEISFKVIETPGHTPGGVCYYCDNILIAGDTLFKNSIGRTDFPGGSYELLIKNIKEKLYILPEETVVYPGHGPETTIGYEKLKNPFTR